MNAQPPVKARTSTTSMMNRMSLDPIITCLQAFSGILGIPFGQLPDLTGGGPPCKSRAAEYDSQGGPPPAPQTCPDLMRSIHHVSEDDDAKSPLSLCRHMSTESTNSWWPCGKTWWSSRSWRSPLLRYPEKKCTKTCVRMCNLAVSRASPFSENLPSPAFIPAAD